MAKKVAMIQLVKLNNSRSAEEFVFFLCSIVCYLVLLYRLALGTSAANSFSVRLRL